METLNILLGLERILYNITLRPCDEEIIKEAKELIQKQGERLADYESTGIEPATIKAAADAKNGILTLASLFLDTTEGRIRELVKADQDGRLVVLPVSMSGTVFWVDKYRKKVEPLRALSVEVDKNGIQEYGCIGNGYTPVRFRPDDFGKTVFLTREEAERCLD